MSIETSQQPDTDSTPAEGPVEGSGLRLRARRRTLGSRLTGGPAVAAAGVLFLLLLTAGLVMAGLFIYQGQNGTVATLESLAAARSAGPGTDAPQDGTRSAQPLPAAKVKEFQADPVFKSPEWVAQVAASREVRQSVHASDVAFAAKAANEVWLPWLTGRVKDAGAALDRFDPAAGDAAELSTATASAARVCEASDAATFVAGQGKASGSKYEAAVAAAFPGLAKAAQWHFCPAGSQVQTSLPFDKEQQRK